MTAIYRSSNNPENGLLPIESQAYRNISLGYHTFSGSIQVISRRVFKEGPFVELQGGCFRKSDPDYRELIARVEDSGLDIITIQESGQVATWHWGRGVVRIRTADLAGITEYLAEQELIKEEFKKFVIEQESVEGQLQRTIKSFGSSLHSHGHMNGNFVHLLQIQNYRVDYNSVNKLGVYITDNLDRVANAFLQDNNWQERSENSDALKVAHTLSIALRRNFDSERPPGQIKVYKQGELEEKARVERTLRQQEDVVIRDAFRIAGAELQKA